MKISYKINAVLKVITICFIFIIIKIWYLTIFQKEKNIINAKRPQTKVLLEKANRGSIYDKNGIGIAINRIKYNACIYFQQIKEIPSFIWEKKNGKKHKKFLRREHISNLAKLLAKELNLDSRNIKDLIYSKAALIPHIPFVIKENISEQEYYKLRMLERDFPGLHAEISHERFYPLGKMGASIIGYLGAINQMEYLKFANQLKTLETILEEENLPKEFNSFSEVKEKLKTLKEKAYTINDLIGKSGLEKQFEEILRGKYGKRSFAIDIKGNFLKELNHKIPVPGKALKTTISSKLQLFCESLLAKYENSESKKNKNTPFIKQGAIVVMKPRSGKILALASYPRFNPNDFIPSLNEQIKSKKQKNILKWLEHPRHIENIYIGKDCIKKEIFENDFLLKTQSLTLSFFLKNILTKNHPIFSAIQKIKNIKNAIFFQEDIESILYFSKKDLYEILEEKDQKLCEKVFLLKRKIQPFLKNIKNTKDKILLIDICSLIVAAPLFSTALIEKVGEIDLFTYWDISRTYLFLEDALKKEMRKIFQKEVFMPWRKKNQISFLKKKRIIEKKEKKIAKPYLYYLDAKENKMFLKFFKKYKLEIFSCLMHKKPFFKEIFPYLKMLSGFKQKFIKKISLIEENFKNLDSDETISFLKTIRPFNQLKKPLFGKHYKNIKTQKDLLTSFYPNFRYLKSQAYRESAPLGSIFKIVTSYAALKKHVKKYENQPIQPQKLNPFTMIDQREKGVVGYKLNGSAYPIFYKKGKLIPSINHNIGKIDLPLALARSSNPYFSILASDYLKNSFDLIEAAKILNIGKKTNISLPGEFAGNLPKDLKNRSDIYAFAIGQHSLVSTPLQVAVMLSAIANGKEIIKPKILQSEKKKSQKIFLPLSIRNTILDGMQKALWDNKGTANPKNIFSLQNNMLLLKKYNFLKHYIVGKTSTAEISYKKDLSSSKAKKYNHIWFCTIYFDPKQKLWEKPLLTVIVYLKFGRYGKDAAPFAIEVIDKYIKLKQDAINLK